MTELYWSCPSCYWIGEWGMAREVLDEDWEGHTVLRTACPKCGSEVNRFFNTEIIDDDNS